MAFLVAKNKEKIGKKPTQARQDESKIAKLSQNAPSAAEPNYLSRFAENLSSPRVNDSLKYMLVLIEPIK